MQRKIRFTRRVLDSLPPCPADHHSSEVEYTSLESPPGLRLVVTKRGVKSWLLRYTISTAHHPAGIKRAIKIGVFPGLVFDLTKGSTLEVLRMIGQVGQ